MLFFLPPSEMIELSFVLNVWMFLLMSMGISIIKDHSFHLPTPIYALQLVIGRNIICYYCYAIFQMVFINHELCTSSGVMQFYLDQYGLPFPSSFLSGASLVWFLPPDFDVAPRLSLI
jgi:hypothetical protein